MNTNRKFYECLTTLKELRNKLPEKEVEYLDVFKELQSVTNWDCKEEVKEMVNINGELLMLASERLRDDDEIVKTALNNNGLSLSFVSDRLSSHYQIVKIAVNNWGGSLKFAKPEFRDDKDLALLAVSTCSNAVEYLSNRLKDDYDVFEKAISYKSINDVLGNPLEYASLRLQSNEKLRQLTKERLAKQSIVLNKKEGKKI